ncbi:MAG: thiamine pyrophosphate-binding protein [Atribacterota bacterium]|nr:thiamine pyrophosphate-binding protein [Atribacterota bacterium]
MKTWELIANMIKEQGIEYVFGIGDTDLQLYADQVKGLNAINLRYEGSAPFMAMAYSRLTGKPGVCSGSSGPGVASLVPGALEAFSGCVPMIIFAPSINQKTEGMGEFQECDQIGMMKPVTKWSARITDIERIPWFVERAFSIAMNGQPGPVFLEMPINLGGKLTSGILVDVEPLQNYKPVKKIRTAGDPILIKDAVELLHSAKYPVIIAGNGLVSAKAHNNFRNFIELLGIPFLTTPGGRGIVEESHPLSLGVCGIYRTEHAKNYYKVADLVISIGSRNEGFQSHSWADFPLGAKFIQIDISPFEIGRNWKPDVAIVGDADLVLQQLLENLKSGYSHILNNQSYLERERIQELAKKKENYEKEVDKECLSEEIPIPAKRIVHEVSKVFGENTILVNENGSQDTWSYCYPYYKIQKGSSCIPVAEQTCMGMGVVGAIAAKLVNPDKKVVCIVGDGAFQMYMKELPTAAQYKAGCTWIVLNNSAFGWIKYNQLKFAGKDISTFKIQPDFVKWAEACNCSGIRVEQPSETKPALEKALQLNEKGIPVVLDIITGLDLSHFEKAL